MELDRISAVLRPRSPWEAIDLGVLMARTWWWPLCRAWLAITLPAFALLHMALFAYPALAIILLWWLKPLWERALLHILSLALFGEMPRLAQTLRTFPKLAVRQWFASLTYRRFSLSRSMDLPVLQLENLRGQQRTRRLRVLHGKTGSGAIWLTVVGAHIEVALPLAFLAVISVLFPSEAEFDWFKFLTAENAETQLILNLLYYAAMSAVAPFYVAAGFSLYINRRTWLEGWDIELVFRRLLNRVRQDGLLKQLGVLGCVVLLLASQSEPSMAETQTLNREQAQTAIETILAGDEFHDRESIRQLDWQREPEKETVNKDWFDWLAQTLESLAGNLRILLWALAVTALFITLYKYRHWLAQYAWRERRHDDGNEPPPSVLFGMQVNSESLPANVPDQVLTLWRRQEYRVAYALLYRASLSRLIHQYRVKLHNAHTEEECRVLISRQSPPELGAYFDELTRHWQRLAYAHERPADQFIDSLCQRWPQLFEREYGDG